MAFLVLQTWSLGCAHGVTVVAPDSCVDATDRQIDDVYRLVQTCSDPYDVSTCDYPGVVERLQYLDAYCCEVDAAAGRDVSHCERPEVPE